MKIFLTGATGYLGQELLKALHNRDHEITALVRSKKFNSSFPSSVKKILGSIEELSSFEAALRGQDVFVHTAAMVKMWARDRTQFDRINVEATQAAIEAAHAAGIPKFVYTSSFIALGPSNGEPLTEDDARRSDYFHNDYERTKYLSDQKARTYMACGYPLYVLYPGVIYGPGNLTHGNIVARNLIPFLKGRMPFGLPIKTWCYAYIGDVINGFLKVIEGTPASRRYILGGENHSGDSFYRALHDVTGKKPPAFNIPFSLARAVGYGEYLLAEFFGREPSLLTHQVVDIYKRSWAYDSTRATRELDYKITPLKEGLSELVSWLKDARYI
jgi:farnesol dehydrogenase